MAHLPQGGPSSCFPPALTACLKPCYSPLLPFPPPPPRCSHDTRGVCVLVEGERRGVLNPRVVQAHVVLNLVRQDIEAVPVVGADPSLQSQELTWEGRG